MNALCRRTGAMLPTGCAGSTRPRPWSATPFLLPVHRRARPRCPHRNCSPSTAPPAPMAHACRLAGDSARHPCTGTVAGTGQVGLLRSNPIAPVTGRPLHSGRLRLRAIAPQVALRSGFDPGATVAAAPGFHIAFAHAPDLRGVRSRPTRPGCESPPMSLSAFTAVLTTWSIRK